MFIIKLTAEQIRALQTFLGRVEIKGLEARTLLSIGYAVENAQEEPQTTQLKAEVKDEKSK